MNLTVEQMNAQPQQFQLLHSFQHQEIIPFLQKFIYCRNPYTIFYWGINILFLGFLGFQIGLDNAVNLDDKLIYAGLGVFVFFFGLVPIHELIHGIAYQIIGAKKVSYKADLRKLMFLTVADKFVANRREFLLVALAPFTIINSLLIISSLYFSGVWFYLILGMLIFHTAGCSGDFGLVSYFYENRQKDILTFDDAANEITYFYEKHN